MSKLIEIYNHRDFSQIPDLQIYVTVGIIESKKASFVLKTLSSIIPLQHFGLNHLKRARKPIKTNNGDHNNDNSKLEIILAPSNNMNRVPQEVLSLLLSTKEIYTYKVAPESKEESDEWNKIWPTYHKPSNLQIDRMNGCSEDQCKLAILNLKAAIYDAERFSYSVTHNNNGIDGEYDGHGAIVVNPLNGKIVMTSYDSWCYILETQKNNKNNNNDNNNQVIERCISHPLYTPVMLCIKGVAELICGNMTSNFKDNLPDKAYLCTGLDFYLLKEPDLMSSMALVHSRARTVTYCNVNIENGGLGTCYQIHDMRQLNHRFRVYKLDKTFVFNNNDNNNNDDDDDDGEK